MNWDAIGAIAEIAGALAVVVSIVYLAIQIRSNTQATKASASFDATHSWSEFNNSILHASDEIIGINLKAYRPDSKASDFTDAEYWRLSALHRTIFQSLEGQYYLYKYGYLEPGVWKSRSEVARGILEIPLMREWWSHEQHSSTYSQEFVDAIERAEPADTININRKG